MSELKKGPNTTNSSPVAEATGVFLVGSDKMEPSLLEIRTYWVWAQFVRLCLLPVVLPVRLYEWITQQFKKQEKSTTEIERKFLVDSLDWTWSEHRSKAKRSEIIQGFLTNDPTSCIRVRIRDGKATLAVKISETSMTRREFEYSIPVADAHRMLQSCSTNIIEKTRFVVDVDGFTWEVDEFEGVYTGLIVAEIELPSEDTEAILPRWIAEEVTGQYQYTNSNMAFKTKNPALAAPNAM